MVFASPIFLFAFLPLALAVYYLVRPRTAALLLLSLAFYAWGEPIYLLLMLFGIGVNWALGLALGKWHKKGLLALALTLDLGMLAVFKYADLIIGSANWLLRTNLPLARLALPLGISFYTFQMMSYIVDVWRGDAAAEKNPVIFGAYVSMFPQLIAGPIVRYPQVSRTLKEQKPLEVSRLGEGARRFCIGLGKKVLIANLVSECADMAFELGGASLNAGAAWMGAACYALQIYYDFSGYSDMAIGLGTMLGFDFPENFNYPYIASSVREFWRRWHMTLSGWFRDYLYIPLGGSRRGAARTCLNLVIVFALCGLWHGASWSFLVWGLYHGLFLALERLPFLKKKRPKLIGVPLTLLIVTVGWVLFRADTLGAAWEYLKAMAGQGGSVGLGDLAGVRVWLAAAAGVLGAVPWLNVVKKRRERSRRAWAFDLAGVLAAALILAACCVLLAGGTYNPFIYFRF